MRSILLGILASFFFAFTFVLNRAMDLDGGSWMWSASLRYFYMAPLLLIIVWWRGNLRPLLQDLSARPVLWLMWSFVGFVLFYASLTYAASSGPGWLVVGTYQLSILAGSLLVPLLYYEQVETAAGTLKVRKKIPVQGVLFSLLILIGVVLLQSRHMTALSLEQLTVGVLPVLIAAIAYPLGYRKMMLLCAGRIDAYQRVLGMTLGSLPFWIILAIYAWLTIGPPSLSQLLQTFFVALSSGVIATILFFVAVDLVKDSPPRLAAVDATQTGQLMFTIILEYLILSAPFPSGWSLVGVLFIVIGMLLHSLASHSQRTSRQLLKLLGVKR